MTEKRYNGWYNYETWVVALWMDNEQGTYDYWREQAKAHWEEAETTKPDYWTREEAATFGLADEMKEDFETRKDGLLEDARQSSSVWADLIGAALSEVNWNDIAENMVNEVRESVAS